MAVVSLTNYIFELSVKMTIVIHKGQSRTAANAEEFGNLFLPEIEKYCDYNSPELGKNINELHNLGIINETQKDRLLDLKDLFRNPYSHASDNKYTKSLNTELYEFDPDTSCVKELKVDVRGNPNFVVQGRTKFAKDYSIQYLFELYKFIQLFDKHLCRLYNIG